MNKNGNGTNIEGEFPDGFIDYLNDSYEAISLPPLPARTSTAANSQFSRIESHPSSILSEVPLIDTPNNPKNTHSDDSSGSNSCTTAAILFMSTVCLVLAISLLVEKSSSHLPLHTQVNRFTVTETLWETTRSITETQTRTRTQTATQTVTARDTITSTQTVTSAETITDTSTTTAVSTETQTETQTATEIQTVTSTTTEFTQPSRIVPRAQAPYEGNTNLAIKSRGAQILTNYTTEPDISPEMLLQPPSHNCWPITEDAAIGMQLGSQSLVSLISVHLEDQYIPNEVLVYSIGGDGSINMVGKSVGSGNIRLDVPLLRLVVRIKSDGHRCVQGIEVLGNS